MPTEVLIPLATVVLAGTIAFASSYFVGARQRADERAWELAKRRTDAYAQFLLRASQWLQAINWSHEKRDRAECRLPATKEAQEIERLHQLTLEPLQIIRFYASDETFNAAFRVLELCHEHQARYFAGNLSGDALQRNHAEWEAARDAFVAAGRRETAQTFGPQS